MHPWSLFAEVNDQWRLGVPIEQVTDYEIRTDQVLLSRDVMDKQIVDVHGFKLAGWRSFEQAVSEETIERVRANAAAKRRRSI